MGTKATWCRITKKSLQNTHISWLVCHVMIIFICVFIRSALAPLEEPGPSVAERGQFLHHDISRRADLFPKVQDGWDCNGMDKYKPLIFHALHLKSNNMFVHIELTHSRVSRGVSEIKPSSRTLEEIIEHHKPVFSMMKSTSSSKLAVIKIRSVVSYWLY